jgi:hypothetical protein
MANANIAVVQTSILLKFRELYAFVLERHSECAAEIRANYIGTVAAYYTSAFDRYTRALMRFQTDYAGKTDLMGIEEAAKRGATSILFSKVTQIKNKTNVFTLGDRVNVLLNPEPGLIIPQAVEDQSQKLPFEVIFKSINRLFLDNASSEYLFTLEFFFGSKKKGSSSGGGGGGGGDGSQNKDTHTTHQAFFNDVVDGAVKSLLVSEDRRRKAKKKTNTLSNMMEYTNRPL